VLAGNLVTVRSLPHLAAIGDNVRLRAGTQHPLQHLHDHLLVHLLAR